MEECDELTMIDVASVPPTTNPSPNLTRNSPSRTREEGELSSSEDDVTFFPNPNPFSVFARALLLFLYRLSVLLIACYTCIVCVTTFGIDYTGFSFSL